MRPVILACLLSTVGAGCQSTAPQQRHRLGELKAGLSALGPVEVTYPLHDRIVLRVDVPAAVALAWDREGRRLAIASRDHVRIIEPYDAERLERRAAFEPLELPPRLLWLADGRLWIAPMSGGLVSPFEVDQPPPIGDVVVAVGPAGRVVLAQSADKWRFAVREADAWRTQATRWTVAAPTAALLDDALLLPAPDGLHVIGAENGETTLPWPHALGPPHAIWSAAGRVCMGFAEGRMVVTTLEPPLRFERWDAPRAVAPGGLIIDGCVGADGDTLVLDGGGARLHDARGSRSLDVDAMAAAVDPTGSRWATMRRDGVYVGAVGAEAHRVAAPSARPAEVAGVTGSDGDEIWVLRADPTLVGRVPGLEASGSLPEPAAIAVGREALFYAGGVVLLVGLIVAAPTIADALHGLAYPHPGDVEIHP